MNNINEQNGQDEDQNLTPLGVEEMNSVIKSFQESSFNQEKLYQKDEINFVKKTLYELAVESEKNENTSSETPEESIDNEVSEKTEDQKNLEASASIDSKTLDENQNRDFKDDSSKVQKMEEKELIANKEDEKSEKPKNADKLVAQTDNDQNFKNENENSETSELKDEKMSEIKNNNFGNEASSSNEESSEKNNKDENFEDETLEALDSVREAVSKSLDENLNENQNNLNDEKLKNIEQSYTEIEDLFKNIKKISVDQIEEIIKVKVLEISTEIAGYQIDKIPQKFLEKIKKVLSELTNVNDEVVIQLSKEDHETLKKIKVKDLSNKNISFEENLELKRGDFSISTGGLFHSITHSLGNN